METVAILIPSLKKGGAEKQAVLLKNALSSNYKILFILFNAELGCEEELLKLGDFKDNTLIKIQGRLIKKILRLHQILRKNRVKYLFTYLTAPNFYGSIIGRLAGVELIFTGIRNAYLENNKMCFEKLASKLATKVISNNHMGEKMLNQHGIKNTCTIPNCYTNLHVVPQKKRKECIDIITVARFTEQKDYLTALKAIKEIHEDGLNVYYTIIGYGTLERQIREWIKELNIENIINIIINPHNIFGYLEKQDIYLSTSLYEGTSNSIMEAMDAELPIVATDVGDNKYLVIEGENGYIHKTGDIKNISASLKQLAQSYELRERFGQYGKSLLKKNHSMIRFKQSYIDLLK